MTDVRSFELTQPDGFVSHVHHWQPDAAIKAVIQLAHGMGEYATRYAPTVEKLLKAGYAVYANDHRGHGPSALESGTQGDFGAPGFPVLASDMATLNAHIRQQHPGTPVILLGHSMGSFASQLFVLDRSEDIQALVLSGSSALDQLAAGFANVELVDGQFPNVLNQPFEPARTEFDWLSRDDAQVDAYIASPLCGFSATPESFGSLLGAGARTADAEALSGIRKDLPIYIFSGARDPVGGNTALLDLLASRYRAAGIRDVETRYYAEGRHEMFNELNRDAVVADLVAWLGRHVGQRG